MRAMLHSFSMTLNDVRLILQLVIAISRHAATEFFRTRRILCGRNAPRRNEMLLRSPLRFVHRSLFAIRRAPYAVGLLLFPRLYPGTRQFLPCPSAQLP